MALLMTHQIRAARAALRMDQGQLAAAAAVSVNTIKRAEAADGAIPARVETGRKLRSALEAAGAVFTGGDQPGVWLGREGSTPGGAMTGAAGTRLSRESIKPAGSRTEAPDEERAEDEELAHLRQRVAFHYDEWRRHREALLGEEVT